MSYQPAGTYTLEKFELRSLTRDRGQGIDPRSRGFGQTRVYDLKLMVHTFNISESMLNASVRGSAVIYDSVGVFYGMPLVGQEILEIEYTDTKGVTHADKFFVYSISDIKPSKNGADDLMEYKLNFVSFGKFWSDRYEIKRCIANGAGASRQYLRIDEQVEILFGDYYANAGGTEKPIYISPTQGEQKIVIPALKPEDAMHLFSRKAASQQFNGHLFRFWENRKQYFFADLEDWFTFGSKELQYDTQLFFYNSGPADNTPEGELAKLQNIISVDFGESVNTIDAMNRGAYYRKFIELDPLTRTSTNSYDYQHKDEYRNRVYPDGEGNTVKLIHSDDFIDEHLNKWMEVYGIKDYPDADVGGGYGLRPTTYYGDIFNNKNSLLWHYNQSKITVRIYGTNEVFAGSIIQIDDLPRFTVQNVLTDEDRVGKYLVESVNNEFFENTYIQTLTLVKGGLRA